MTDEERDRVNAVMSHWINYVVNELPTERALDDLDVKAAFYAAFGYGLKYGRRERQREIEDMRY